jgi:hypothetical protein
MALIEFVRFRVRPENVAALLRARAAMIEAFRMDNPGYVGGVMARIGEQDWIDLAVWQSESCCQDALAAAGPSTEAFLSLIDEVLGQERGTVVDGSWAGCAA